MWVLQDVRWGKYEKLHQRRVGGDLSDSNKDVFLPTLDMHTVLLPLKFESIIFLYILNYFPRSSIFLALDPSIMN